VAGPEGVRFQPYSSSTSQLNVFDFAIFNKCKNKEAAFRLANYECNIEAATVPVKQYLPKVSLPRDLFMDKDTSDTFAKLKKYGTEKYVSIYTTAYESFLKTQK